MKPNHFCDKWFLRLISHFSTFRRCRHFDSHYLMKTVTLSKSFATFCHLFQWTPPPNTPANRQIALLDGTTNSLYTFLLKLSTNVPTLTLNHKHTRKYPLCGYILGVLSHTTTRDRLWGGDGF